MAVLGNRATGIMDYIERMGSQFIPANISPAPDTPLQREMNRPYTQMSQGGQGMITTKPSGQMSMASPVTPPRMISEMTIPDMGGSGVSMTPEMMKKAEAASKVVERIQQQPELEQNPSFRKMASDFFGNRENMLRMALAFNTMRLQPDQGLAGAIGSELKDIRETRQATSLANRTAEYFEKVDPKIAAAIRGGLSPKDAIALYREEGRVVGKMIVNPRTGDVIYDGTGEGSELPAAFRTLQERAKAAGLTPGTPQYTQFMINGGQKTKGLAISVDKDGNIQISEGGETIQKLTDSQSNALTFGGRMQSSGGILNQVEQQGTKLFESIVQNIPIAGNYLLSPEYQSYSQAKRDFINAVLRKESGAAIAASEFDNAEKQYFPQPGDTQQVIDQKRANRELATKLMMSGVPIKGLTEDPRVILQNTAQSIAKPAGVSQPIWDAMTDEEKLAFK